MSEEKPHDPRKPKAESEKVKGERQKAKGGSSKPNGESEKQKAESVKPKAVSARKPAVGQKGKAKPPEIPAGQFPELKPSHSAIDIPHSEIQSSEITMEVHHHPQLDHNPKPIKEYLLEGLMIFIAVMMGFIAENVREYIDNNEHARQLCAQLVKDLKADTAMVNNISFHTAMIARQNDSLLNMLQLPLASLDSKKVLHLAEASHSMWPFHPAGGAIGAIKNELHLKQFSNSGMISYIADYEADIQLMHTAQDITLQYQRLYLDPFLLQHFNPGDVNDVFNRRPLGNVLVRNLSQADMTQTAGEMALMHVITNEQVRDCFWLKRDATKLLQYVQKHFDVE